MHRDTAPIAVLAALILLVVGIGLSVGGESEEQLQRDHYCEMVEIYEQTGGEFGWPAFDGECEG